MTGIRILIRLLAGAAVLAVVFLLRSGNESGDASIFPGILIAIVSGAIAVALIEYFFLRAGRTE